MTTDSLPIPRLVDRKQLLESGLGEESVERPRFDALLDVGPCVYFIESAGLVKIGLSRCIAARYLELRKVIPTPIRLVAVVERVQRTSILPLEKRLHARFAVHRHHGEWFDLPDGWLDEIDDDRLMLPSAALLESL